jgi:hypothetical protein
VRLLLRDCSLPLHSLCKYVWHYTAAQYLQLPTTAAATAATASGFDITAAFSSRWALPGAPSFLQRGVVLFSVLAPQLARYVVVWRIRSTLCRIEIAED